MFSFMKKKPEEKNPDPLLTKSYEQNINLLKQKFSYGKNQDFKSRKTVVSSLKKEATLFYLEGMSKTQTIEREILPILSRSHLLKDKKTSFEEFFKELLPAITVKVEHRLSKIVNELLNGNTVIILDGYADAIVVSTTSFEKRNVEKPEDENVLKGPKEAFIESLSTNISLIRKQLRSADLISQKMTIGKRGITEIAILYMNGIVDPNLIQKVEKRLEEITVDEIQNLGILEQHIEERPYSLVPTVLYTERPDRAVGFLNEGHIVLLMDSSPSCLIVPVTFWSFFHTPEEYYARWAYANFTRLLRVFAIFVTIMTPGLYIAVTNYHVEMLPTDLVLAISATREEVPFPAIFETVMLLIAFELIREGGVRVPTPIGPTIGIVGALILGQAAVEANIISPILVIVVAVTGLASFAIPNLSFNYMIRLSTYIFLAFAAVWGFLGIAVCITLCIGYLSTVTSFDVPFLAPLSPHYPSSKDLVFRPAMWKQWLRPQHVRPKDDQRMQKPEGEKNQ